MAEKTGGSSDPGYDEQVEGAGRAFTRLAQFKKGCEAALWAGIALFSLLIVAAPRFSTLLLHLFNDPFAADRSYTAAAPVFLMVCSLLLVWLFVELLLVVRRLPDRVISQECASGLRRGAVALLALAVLQIIRVIAFPVIDAAVGAVLAVIAAVLGLCLSTWVGWQAHARTAAAITARGAASHRRA